MDVASEVSASVDMLRAAKQFAADRHVALDDTVRVTGFSQGGTAATATAEALQNGVDRWRLTAIAPISGPYDVQHTELPALVDGNHQDGEIVAAVPPTAAQLLTPAYMERLRHPSGPLLAAMRQNDRTRAGGARGCRSGSTRPTATVTCRSRTPGSARPSWAPGRR
jgi:hypothetical protein